MTAHDTVDWSGRKYDGSERFGYALSRLLVLWLWATIVLEASKVI